MKLKHFYDHFSRPFDCSLAVGGQRSNPFTTSGACVVANCHDCYESTPLLNPLSPHDALKHHFTSLKTDLIFPQQRVLERKFP